MGSPGSNAGGLALLNRQLFFSADDGVHGTELWESDGTTTNTQLARDTYPTPANAYPEDLTALDGKMLFAATDAAGRQLWITDGGFLGTQMVTLINDAGDADPEYLTAAGDRAFFRAYEPDSGLELWCSAGTAAHTAMARDILTGPQSSNPDHMATLNGTLFFRANDGTHARELWVLDIAPSQNVYLPLVLRMP